MTSFFKNSCLAISLILGMVASASAQDIYSANMAFDAQMNAQLNTMQQDLNNRQVQFWQSVMQSPEVQSAYQQHRAQGGQYSYEQFVYWYAMTAAGTNYQGAMDAQRRQFEGWQQANRTVQEGYDSYNHGWWQNQARTDAAMQRYTDGAINGNWYYQDPSSGTTYTLPYTSGAGYYQSGGNTFYMDANGQYYMYNGGGWSQMNMVNR